MRWTNTLARFGAYRQVVRLHGARLVVGPDGTGTWWWTVETRRVTAASHALLASENAAKAEAIETAHALAKGRG